MRLTEWQIDLQRYEYKRDEKGYCFLSEGQLVNKLGQLEDDEEELKLRDLHEFLQCLEPNTLFRIMPYEKAKIIDEFRRKFMKEELL